MSETVEIKENLTAAKAECQAGHFSAYTPISYNSSARKSAPRAVFKGVDSVI